MIFGEYSHEFKNDAEAITGQFINDSTNTKFRIEGDGPDRNYFTFGGRATASFGNGRSAYAMYQGLAGYENLTLHNFEVGVRLDF